MGHAWQHLGPGIGLGHELLRGDERIHFERYEPG